MFKLEYVVPSKKVVGSDHLPQIAIHIKVEEGIGKLKQCIAETFCEKYCAHFLDFACIHTPEYT